MVLKWEGKPLVLNHCKGKIMEENTQKTEEKKEAPKKVEEKTPEAPKKKKKSKIKIIGLVIVVLVIWFGAVQYMAAERYDAVVNVIEGENKVGVNPTSESLDFGDLSRETAQTRTVTIKNTGKSDKYIMVWKRGEIAEIMDVSKNNFTLKAGEEAKIEFNVKVPKTAEIRKYSGKVVIFKGMRVW